MVTIAITGGIACGKTLVGHYMREAGIPVCETDEVGHEVLAKGGTVHEEVVRAFGATVLRADGEISRPALGKMVFADPEKLACLNRLTHPEIMRRLRQWIASQPTAVECVAAIVPLLHEIGDEAHWDHVVCVAAPEADQRKRLRERGLTDAESLARIQAQLAQAVKMEHSDYVIFNCGDKDLLREQTTRVVRSIRGEGL